MFLLLTERKIIAASSFEFHALVPCSEFVVLQQAVRFINILNLGGIRFASVCRCGFIVNESVDVR
jgi:hypothetical protein